MALQTRKVSGGKVEIFDTAKPDQVLHTAANVSAALDFMTEETNRREAAIAEKSRDTAITVKVRPKGEMGKEFNGKSEPMKGNIGLYGVQTRPVTLYAAQWRKVFEQQATFAGAILVNADKLDWKSDAEKQATLSWARQVTEQAGNANATGGATSE